MTGKISPDELKSICEQSLNDDKAIDIETIPLKSDTAIADYMIIASAQSTRGVVRLAEKLEERLHAYGMKGIRTEGKTDGNWVIVDAGDIIIHLFRPEVRAFYNIEKMWREDSSVMTAIIGNGSSTPAHA